ncbi:MAG TPA: serine--tRNA ligase [Mycobacteriales bacterium]|nr:serine--tRNA ligase [Mycobacteriales bacterium]
MIDLKVLRDDPDAFRRSQRARGEDPGLVDEVLAADEQRRAAVTRADTLRAESNAASKAIQSADPAERPTLIEKAKSLKDDVKAAEAEQADAEIRMRDAAERLPNLVEDGVPEGGEEDYVVLETIGEVPSYDFAPLDHVELGARLGAIDVDRGAKVSGARFYYLTGVGAELELALFTLAWQQAIAAGFVPMVPPVLVKPEAMAGTGFLGQTSADDVYRIAQDDLYLVGTSEVALAAYHMDEILDADRLPLRYTAFSPCFRREAGSYGKDTRGIIRVHQFDKVEMFSFCRPQDARDEHRRLLEWEKQFLTSLELPFRVIDVASGDLGLSAARKFDCEAWIPTQGKYRELTSTSNCTGFQARRLNIRFRGASGPEPVATLNGTLVAIPRTIVALLEVHQQADGSVRVPKVLQSILGREVLEPVR